MPLKLFLHIFSKKDFAGLHPVPLVPEHFELDFVPVLFGAAVRHIQVCCSRLRLLVHELLVFFVRLRSHSTLGWCVFVRARVRACSFGMWRQGGGSGIIITLAAAG